MTKLEGMTNEQMTDDGNVAFLSFRLRASFVIRLSCFVIASAFILMTAIAQAESPNLIGKWNVEITFANDEHRSLRFEARSDGKGTLELLDPRAKVWGSATSSEAKWTRSEGNAVTFSGPIEFLLGNVGRDAGTLVCRGKLETPELITGEAEFSPLVGERPSKHGTFRGTRAK
jgi:hypothetical protein